MSKRRSRFQTNNRIYSCVVFLFISYSSAFIIVISVSLGLFRICSAFFLRCICDFPLLKLVLTCAENKSFLKRRDGKRKYVAFTSHAKLRGCWHVSQLGFLRCFFLLVVSASLSVLFPELRFFFPWVAFFSPWVVDLAVSSIGKPLWDAGSVRKGHGP